MTDRDEHEGDEHARGHIGTRGYLLTWLALLGLTVASFTVSEVHLGHLDVVIMLFIALFKGTLVVLIFMHLLEARFASRMVMAVTMFFVVLLISLMTADIATRKTFPAGPQAPGLMTATPTAAAISPGPARPR